MMHDLSPSGMYCFCNVAVFAKEICAKLIVPKSFLPQDGELIHKMTQLYCRYRTCIAKL